MTKNGESEESTHVDKTIRTYSKEIADFLVEKGGVKNEIHSYDNLTLWEVSSVPPDVVKDEDYIRLNFNAISQAQQYIFQRLCPPIYTVGVDDAYAYAELDSGISCILLARDEEKLKAAIEEKGDTFVISSWEELEHILTESKEDSCNSVAIILGKGSDGEDYLETYKTDSVLFVATTLAKPN